MQLIITMGVRESKDRDDGYKRSTIMGYIG